MNVFKLVSIQNWAVIEIFENIRKVYEFKAPCQDLAAHIDFFSESSLDATRQYIAAGNFSIKMFPSWTPTFYINLGERYHITVGNRTYAVGEHQDIAILRNNIVERHNEPTDHIFTVKFYPGSLEAILDINQTGLIDRVTDLSALLPVRLLLSVKEASTFEERVTILEAWLLNRYQNKNNNRLHFVREAIDNYLQGDLLPGMNELAERQFVSSKTFNRNFHRIIGTSPKNYFSVIRARTALSAYVLRDPLFTPTAFGYYDMSHFYKEVIAFTGQKLTVSKRLI
jgi:AraC-like DNA-binding protein